MVKAKIEELPEDLKGGKGIVISSENEEEAELLLELMNTGASAVVLSIDENGSVEIKIAPPAVPDEK